MQACPSLDQTLKTFKTYFDNPQGDKEKLSLSRKRDLIDQISQDIPSLAKRTLMTYQPQIVSVVIGLSNFGCGASLQRGMSSLLIQLYTLGDFTKMQIEFFDIMIPLLHNEKGSKTQTNAHIKVNACYLTSKLFKSLWMRCSSPPTKDLIDVYFKVVKNSTEKHQKECAYRAIKNVIKANPSNFHQISADVFKHIQKSIQLCDKATIGSDEALVKADAVRCLRAFVQSTLNYSSLHMYFEQILAATIKGFEDINSDVTEEYIQICYYLFNLRLSESQMQGDLKTTVKIFNQQQRDSVSAQQKKKLSQPAQILDVPRSLGDIISFISAILLKIQANAQPVQSTMDNLRYALSQVLARLVETNRLHLEAMEPENFLTPILLSCHYAPAKQGQAPTLKEIEIQAKQREISTWILTQIVGFYKGTDQAAVLLKQCIQCLQAKQIVGMQKETFETFSGFCKNLKVSSLINENQTIVLLRLVNDILYISDGTFIKKNFTSEKEIIDPIMPYIKDQQSSLLRFFAVEIIKTIGFRAKHCIQELISIFLTLTTMSNADITSLRQVPVYSHLTISNGQSIKDSSPQAIQLYEQIQNLNALAQCLSALIFGINHSLNGGVPLTLINTAFNAAKSMVTGNWKVEDEDDETFYCNDLQKIDLQENQRREAGWIILEGMINLGNQWMGTKLSVFFKMLNSVFSKEMCSAFALQLIDPNYLEKILNEFRIKKAALSVIRSFLQKCNVLLSNQLWKLIGTFLVNATSFFLNHDKDKREIMVAFKKHFGDEELRQVKSDLYECLLMLPSGTLYASKFVHLLHSVCEDIVSEHIQTAPSVQKKLKHFEDIELGGKSEKPTRYLAEEKIDTLKLNHNDSDIFDISQLLRNDLPLTQMPQSGSKDRLLSNSILLFADIFSSSQLNIKNKQQLIKHFLVHSTNQSQPAQTQGKKAITTQPSEQKLNKIISIGLTILAVAKKYATKSIQEGQILESELESQCLLILKNCEQFGNTLLIKIQAEGEVFLRIPKIVKDPTKQYDILLKEQEVLVKSFMQVQSQDDFGRKSIAIGIIGNSIRFLDFESVISPFAERIVNLFQKLGKENHGIVREFYLHYSMIIVKRAGADFHLFFNQIFPTCFHQMQTDVKTNYLILENLGQMVETQLRQDQISVNDSRRAQVVISEFIDIFYLRSNPDLKNFGTALTAINIIKSVLILDAQQLAGKEMKIICKTLALLRLGGGKQLNLHIKMKCVELLSAFLYKGYINVIRAALSPKIDDPFITMNVILDELNSSYYMSACAFSQKRLQKKLAQGKLKKLMSSNEEFETLINYRQQNNFENEKAVTGCSPTEKLSTQILMYRHSLEVLYTVIFKMAVGQHSISETIEHTKYLVQLKHTTLVQQFEEQKKQPAGSKQSDIIGESGAQTHIGQFNFSFDLNEHTRYFATRVFKNYISLYQKSDIQSGQNDLKKHLGQLISLAFAVTSDDSTLLKKAGLSLIIVLVKLFRESIENIRDEEDEEEQIKDKQSQKLKAYIENPLLLEQYEAQIFSIIRQNMQSTDASVLLKNYKLIYQFLTVPICKDASIIGKIISMLTDQMGSLQIFNLTEMLHCEKVLTEMHFKKLLLLSKLIIACCSYEPFKYIETNPKRIKEGKVIEGSGLPSKFQKDDKHRILDVLNSNVLSSIVNHLLHGLQDCMLLTSMPKQALKGIKEFTFIRGSTRSAYNQETVEQSIQYFLKCISYIGDVSSRPSMKPIQYTQDQSDTINVLLSSLLSAPLTQLSKDGDNIHEDIVLSNQINSKLMALEVLNKLIQDGSNIVKDQQEIEQYTQILSVLSRYGITELNHQIVIFYKLISQMIQNEFKQPFMQDFYTKVVQTLVSLQPEIIGQSRLEAPLTIDDLKVVTVCMESMLFISKEDMELQESVLALMTYKIPVAFSLIAEGGNEGHLFKLYTHYICQIVKIDSPIIKQSVLELIDAIAKCQKISKGTQHQVVVLCNMIFSIREEEDVKEVGHHLSRKLLSSKDLSLISMILKIFAAYMNSNDVSQSHLLSISTATLAFIFDHLKRAQEGDETMEPNRLLPESESNIILEAITFLVNTCYSKLKPQQDATPTPKLTMLEHLILLIFTIIQSKTILTPQVRNSQVQQLFTLFQSDAIAFKVYLQQLNSLNQAERSVIEKVLREISAQKQSATPSAQVKNETIVSADSKKPQGSIQLSMNFKKKQ